ncbi:MAG: general stress protein [Actinomycetota bacterium]|nr:general stress protein [Actinomycetota bacterium]
MTAPLVSVPGRVEEGIGEQPPAAPPPHAVVAVYASEEDLTAAIKHLEQAKFDMANISVLGKGISEERHVVGFETPSTHTTRWAKWGGMWGWIFGAFVFIPGVGHVAIGGYLLFLLLSTAVGATGGALAGALTGVGIPTDGIPKYEADLRADRFLVVAHGTPAEVELARGLLGQTTHERIDHHNSVAPTSGETESAP